MKMTGLLLLAPLALIAACGGDGVERPPPTDIRVFQAAVRHEQVAFRREERIEATLQYGVGIGKTFDSGPYDFHLDYLRVDTGLVGREESFAATLSPDSDYLFVIVSEGSDLKTLLVATENAAASETGSRYYFVHAHPTLGPVDVYVVDPDVVTGCEVAGISPLGQASYGPNVISFEVPTAGSIRLCLTAPGDSSTVFFESIDTPVGITGRDFSLIAYDSTGLTSSPVSVSIMETTAIRLNRTDVPPMIRVLQTVDDGLARDVFRDDEATPLFAAPVESGTLSDYVDFPAGVSEIKLAPPGGGEPEASISIVASAGLLYTVIFAGDTTDGVTATLTADNARPIVGQATLQLIHAAGMHDAIEIFIRNPGDDITDAFPTSAFNSAPGLTTRFPFRPGDYEITIVDSETDAVLAGPNPITFQDEGVYALAVLNNPADPTTVLIDDFYD
jgi:hypothetical protein